MLSGLNRVAAAVERQSSVQLVAWLAGGIQFHRQFNTLLCRPPRRYNQREENGGQRIATVLMYLSTPEEGGETVFPQAEKKVGGWREREA